MNTTNWKHYYSINRAGEVSETGAIYEPLVNPDGTILCMNFAPNTFRKQSYSSELRADCFAREVKYLQQFAKYPWCPKLLEVDYDNLRVFIEWNEQCCEKIICTGQPMPANWKEQLEQIVRDIRNEEVYKITMYMCYHFVDKQGIIKAFAFYTTCDYAEQPIAIDMYRPILNEERSKFIDEIAVDGRVDFAILNEYSLCNYIKWPEDPLPEIYHRVYQSVESNHTSDRAVQ